MRRCLFNLVISSLLVSPLVARPRRINLSNQMAAQNIATQENAKEIRGYSKEFCNQSKKYIKQLKENRRFKKSMRFRNKNFDLNQLNRPFIRHRRSKAIGVAPLFKLPRR